MEEKIFEILELFLKQHHKDNIDSSAFEVPKLLNEPLSYNEFMTEVSRIQRSIAMIHFVDDFYGVISLFCYCLDHLNRLAYSRFLELERCDKNDKMD